MIKYHGLNHNPIHIPSCSADCKKAASDIFFLLHRLEVLTVSFSFFLISLHISFICVYGCLTYSKVCNLFSVHRVSEWSTTSRHDRAVKPRSGSKKSARQFRINSPTYLKWISFGLDYCKNQTHKCTRCVCVWTTDLVHRDQQSAVTSLAHVKHLGTHENGNGSAWTVDRDQSVSSSGLFIKLEQCPLGL